MILSTIAAAPRGGKLLLLLVLMALPPSAAAQNLGPDGAAKLPIADLHFHAMVFMDPAELMRRMDQQGIRWTGGAMVEAGSGAAFGGLANRTNDIKAALGDRYIVGVAPAWARQRQVDVTNVDTPWFNQRLAAMERQLRQGARVVGEVLVNKSYPPFRMPADAPTLRALFELAIRYNVPFNIHAEWKDETPAEVHRLAAAYRHGTLVLSHCSHIPDAEVVRAIFAAHPNILCDLSYRNAPQIDPNGPLSFRIIFSRSGVSRAWRQLIIDYPDRFFVGIDDVRDWTTYDGVAQAIRFGLIANLPSEVAEKVAYKNAMRLFRLE